MKLSVAFDVVQKACGRNFSVVIWGQGTATERWGLLRIMQYPRDADAYSAWMGFQSVAQGRTFGAALANGLQWLLENRKQVPA